jgi:uncharacterized protein YggE
MAVKRIGLLVGVLVVAVWLSAWTADRAETAGARIVTVTGSAQVRVVPDEVILALGVETWDADLSVAKRENDARVQRVLALVAKYEIRPEHVKTDYVNIHPGDHYYNRGDGFWVRKSIVLTVRDLTRFEELLTDTLEAGATHIHEVRFQTTELRAYKDQARALAVRAAREKAGALSGELGQKVGEPLEIRELHANWWYGASWWGARWGSGLAQNVVQELGDASALAGQSIAPGQIMVDASVTVSFALLP